jgi:hypothetical protein
MRNRGEQPSSHEDSAMNAGGAPTSSPLTINQTTLNAPFREGCSVFSEHLVAASRDRRHEVLGD